MEHIEPLRHGISSAQTAAAPSIRVLAILLCTLAVLAVVDSLLARSSTLSYLDSAIVSSLYEIRLNQPGLIVPFLVVTNLGSDFCLILVVLALAFWGLIRNRRADATWLLAMAIFARVLGWSAKLILQSPRPHLLDAPAIHKFAGYGFPSGHSLMSMVVYGAAALLIVRYATTKPIRIAAAVLCALLIAAIGFSRVYLGAHWTNDVIGGYLYGACILVAGELARKVKTSDAFPDPGSRISSRDPG